VRIDPAQSPADREDGFILIEVLVSALILSIVAAAVLALLSSTTRSAASQRVHAQAVALAQENQARLRTMRITKLNRLEPTPETVELDGTKFTVKSSGVFVNNTTGTVSCSGGETAVTDYVEITSSVSASELQHPVELRSIVSPSNGSLDPTHGTISFKAANASNQPLSGVVISGSGTGLSSFNGETDVNGCANFADLIAGNYSVITSAHGMVNRQGETTTTQPIGAPSAGTQAVQLFYDSPGSVKVKFKYRVGSGGTYAEATADSIEAYNGELGKALTVLAPGGTRALEINATNLYPFSSKYAIYAGACETGNPDPKEEKKNQEAIAFLQIERGKAIEPVPTIQLPALNLTIQSSSGAAVSGARVTITDANSNCKLNGNPVKRVYTTNASGNPSNGASGPAEYGLPFGKYNICASTGSGTQFRRVETSSVPVESLSNWEVKTLKLPSSSNSTSACP
jgi:Tfp pilus assembly protein PilV